jgi:hypothetical protein
MIGVHELRLCLALAVVRRYEEGKACDCLARLVFTDRL